MSESVTLLHIMHSVKIVLVVSAYFTVIRISALPTQEAQNEDIPPPPKFKGVFDSKQDRQEIDEQMNNWKPQNEDNIWELSGLYQGDIMSENVPLKNGLLDDASRWPDAVIPYHIDKDDFAKEQIKQIEDALKDYHEKTCVRFRPFKKGDKDFITVKGDGTGCWSYVGKHGEGQVVNFQNPGCLRHGTIIHEFMHALGFYHQQSAADRDEWVKIVWDNIKTGREHNFDKYDNDTVSDYGAGYDYGSVMHYSATAFSKNGEKTIVPKKENVTLGQRNGFSEKDIRKVNEMYKIQCESRAEKEKEKEKEKESAENSNVTDIISSIWPFNKLAWFKGQ